MRWLNHSLQSIFRRLQTRLMARHHRTILTAVSTPPPPRVMPYVVIGPFSSSTGIGQAARYHYQALTALGLQPAYYDVTRPMGLPVDMPFQNSAAPFNFNDPATAQASLLLHCHPQQQKNILHALGIGNIKVEKAPAPQTQPRRLIGCWHFVEQAAPPAWQDFLHGLHELWVPSRYSLQALQALTPPIPVHIVPTPVTPPAPSAKDRYDFGLPQKALLVYASASLDTMARKNPLGALDAFQSAFGDDTRYCFVLKLRVTNPHNPALAEIMARLGTMPNARLVTNLLTADDHAALLRCADIIICPSRAESFGLLEAQALWLGKPLVAVAYSGTADFITAGCARLINYRVIPAPHGGTWAQPDPEHAAELLFELAQDETARAQLGQQAREKAAAFFSLNRYRAAINSTGK